MNKQDQRIELQTLAKAAGVKLDQRVVLYCGVGISASLGLFALHLAGYYDLALMMGLGLNGAAIQTGLWSAIFDLVISGSSWPTWRRSRPSRDGSIALMSRKWASFDLETGPSPDV